MLSSPLPALRVPPGTRVPESRASRVSQAGYGARFRRARKQRAIADVERPSPLKMRRCRFGAFGFAQEPPVSGGCCDRARHVRGSQFARSRFEELAFGRAVAEGAGDDRDLLRRGRRTHATR